jgi:hypothetical protein
MGKRMKELNRGELIHLAGLLDGEGYIGIRFYRASKHFLGYGFRPVIKIALNQQDSTYLQYLQHATQRGRIERNRKSGLVWCLERQSDCMWLIQIVKKHSRLPTARKRLCLLETIIRLLPHRAPLTVTRWTRLKPVILELRSLSKKKRNRNRFTDSKIEALRPRGFGAVGLTSEAMVAEPAAYGNPQSRCEAVNHVSHEPTS